MAPPRGARVHYALDEAAGNSLPLTAGALCDLMPDLAAHDVYLCGPPGMTEAATARPARRRSTAPPHPPRVVRVLRRPHHEASRCRHHRHRRRSLPDAGPQAAPDSGGRSRPAGRARPQRVAERRPVPRERDGTSGTFTGDTIDTAHGPVQVRVTLVKGRLTAVTALKGEHDEGASADAVPRLTQEALGAQSAQIDAVSGATFTSQGYISSLQSALDQAHD